jgi:hypothetical protein
MLSWIKDFAVLRVPTPERRAQKALSELLMELFDAELRMLDAQMLVEHHRARLAFLEEVAGKGLGPMVERATMRPKGPPQPQPQSLHGSENKLTPAR